jgi:hypothetical protein
VRVFPDEFHKSGSTRSGVPTFRPDCIECHRKLDRTAKRKKRAQEKDASREYDLAKIKAQRAKKGAKSVNK